MHAAWPSLQLRGWNAKFSQSVTVWLNSLMDVIFYSSSYFNLRNLWKQVIWCFQSHDIELKQIQHFVPIQRLQLSAADSLHPAHCNVQHWRLYKVNYHSKLKSKTPKKVSLTWSRALDAFFGRVWHLSSVRGALCRSQLLTVNPSHAVFHPDRFWIKYKSSDL